MGFIRQYLLSVIASALFCAVIAGLVGEKSAHSSIIKMLIGIFMAIVVILPLKRLDFSDIPSAVDAFRENGEGYSQTGTQYAREELEKVIKQQTEAYILSKAASMDLIIEVEVTLDENEPPTPNSVVIKGTVPPYAKTKLQTVITDDLGIAKENQKWI